MVVIRLARGGAKKRPFLIWWLLTRDARATGASSSVSVFTIPKRRQAGNVPLRSRASHLPGRAKVRKSAIRQRGSSSNSAPSQPPEHGGDGRVTAPFGVKGWIKIYALTAQPGNLREYPVWWLARDGDWREMRVAAAQVHNNMLVANSEGSQTAKLQLR